MVRRLRLLVWCVLTLALPGPLGCVAPVGSEYPHVAGELHHRTGHAPEGEGLRPLLPPGVDLGDGLSEDEVVRLALCNNAAFHEMLADLGLARADLIQAGLLSNPDLWLLSPVGVKQLEFAVTFPLEALWLRPARQDAAGRESGRVAERLVQSGLDLARDARWAWADVLLATERRTVAAEVVRLRQAIANIAAARLAAGDATPLEETTTRIDLFRAREEAARLVHDETIAVERMRNFLGLSRVDVQLAAQESTLPGMPEVELPVLVDEALASRPAVRSTALAVDAARRRADLARCDYLLFSGIIDANGRGEKGFEIGPGFRAILPIFNHNEGMIARADAEVVRLQRQLETVSDRVALEVREAYARFIQAREDLKLVRSSLRPAADRAIALATRAYREGETALLQVLDNTRQLIDVRLREAQVRADLRRAWADLERSVGRRLADPAGGVPPGVIRNVRPDPQENRR